jgi:hypothetical protein
MKMRTETRLGHPERYFYFFLLLICYSVYATPTPNSIILSARQIELVNQIGEYERNSRFDEVDSLYRMLDSCNALNTEQLKKWVHCRELLNRYAGSVELYCRLMAADFRFGDAVYSRLYQLFEDAPHDSIGRALAAFEKCALGMRGIDTLSVRFRLARCYAGYGLDTAEVNVMASASGPPAKIVPRLLEMARERYAGGKYAAAICPALLAYERAGGGRVKTGAADLLYQAYRAVRRYDSALVWITRSDLSNESRKTDAVALYQRAGKLAEAKALIGTLSHSFSRDTLELRQYLYGGDTRGAREFAQQAFAARPQLPDEALLWNVRTLLFDGAFDDLSALLDTARPAASWPGTADILDCRLMLKMLQNSTKALEEWSPIEYDIFTGKTGRVLSRFSEHNMPPDDVTVFLGRIIRQLIAQWDTTAVIPIFMKWEGSVDSPEYLYLYAEHLLRATVSERTSQASQASGSEQAREVLLRIIRDYPDNVFSEKSRVLLAKIQSKKR